MTPDAPSSAARGGWRARFSLEALAFHLTLLVFLVGSQVAQVATRGISADNSWHFRLARDVLSGRQIYWSAVDANRLFPDLLFSMGAWLMPSGGEFATWIYNFHAIVSALLYLSLAALAATLFEEVYARRVFLLIAVPALSIFFIVMPFWGFWLMVPGNHGAGLPICFFSLALLFSMNRQAVLSGPGAAAFVLMVSLLIASNRLLLISFVAPLLISLVGLLVYRWRGLRANAAPTAGRRADRLGTFLFLIAMTAVAGFGGILVWRILGDLRWHKLVAAAGMPSLAPNAEWLVQTLTKEASELTLAFGTSYAWDIATGLLLLIAAIVAGGLFLLRTVRGRPLNPEGENGAVFVSFAAVSALAAMAFTVVKTDDSGTWHYRYLAMSTAFAIVALSYLPVLSRRLSTPFRGLTGGAVVVLAILLAVTVYDADRRKLPPGQSEATFERSIRDLARQIGRHSSAPKLRGYSEYWLANDISTRSDVLQVGILDSLKAEFRFYNNNAADVCSDDHFFVLYSPKKDEPKRTQIVDVLGEPASTEEFDLAQHEVIKIFYYDPAVIRDRITLRAREDASHLFPGFKCKS